MPTNGYVKMWDNWSKKRSSIPVYDLWLDEYKDILEKNKDNDILDLGCGIGADTLYLIERGYSVLSCDFSKEALKSVEDNIPNSKTMYLNMLEDFPIDNDTYSLIIADLSLQYFNNKDTIHIMNEIKRILKTDGILLARVASVNDFNFGAGVGEELEMKKNIQNLKYYIKLKSKRKEIIKMNFKVNDYDKFAEKRHFEVTNGMKKSLRFVEKPMMLSMLPNIEGKRVLLLGCGTAEESDMLSKYNPKKITGIDISKKSIAIAKESYPNCDFYVGDMLNLPFKENEFDFIFSSLAITHVEDKDKVFKELYRVLDDNGQVLFSVGHPMRFATETINYNGNNYHVIGFEAGRDGNQVLGKYMSHTKQVNHFKDNEVLEEFIAPPSYYFEILKHNNFVVEDFKESRCIDECKEIDEAYYNRFHEIPQFIGFLVNKNK